MSFANLFWLASALLLVPILYLTRRKEKIRVAGGIHRSTPSGRVLSRTPGVLLFMAATLAAVALCRPFVMVNEQTSSTVQGRDIIMALDWSASMAEEYKGERKVRKHSPWYDTGSPARGSQPGEPADSDKNLRRIDAAQDSIVTFAETRRQADTGDHIGLIIFDHQPILRWPLDRDLKQLTRHGSFLPKGKGAQELGVGTNFGGENPGPIDLAAEHFKEKGKSTTRVLVLVTDGEKEMDNEAMTRLSRVITEAGMKIYVIGIGEKIGNGELSLEKLCRDQGGKVFRAETQSELDKCFAQINALESSPIPVVSDKSTEPVFYYPLIAALFMYVLALISEAVILGR